MNYFSSNTKKEILVAGSFLPSGQKPPPFPWVSSAALPCPLLFCPGWLPPGSGQRWRMSGLWAPGRTYYFVGRPGAGFGGWAGWELQASPLLLHGATLVPPHAVNLLLHTHLDLALAGEHSTLGALLLQWETGLWQVPRPPPSLSICPNALTFSFSGKLACSKLNSPRKVCPSPDPQYL